MTFKTFWSVICSQAGRSSFGTCAFFFASPEAGRGAGGGDAALAVGEGRGIGLGLTAAGGGVGVDGAGVGVPEDADGEAAGLCSFSNLFKRICYRHTQMSSLSRMPMWATKGIIPTRSASSWGVGPLSLIVKEKKKGRERYIAMMERASCLLSRVKKDLSSELYYKYKLSPSARTYN